MENAAAPKITIGEYLAKRGPVKALTAIEAHAFGIEYPLVQGWARRHGRQMITQAMIDQLRASIATANKFTAEKASRALDCALGLVDVAMVHLVLRADCAPFASRLERLALLLESLDARERLDRRLLRRFIDATNGIGSQKLYECSSVPARLTNELVIRVDGGEIVRELESALRALGFEIQD